ncbi:M20/M25/M40 family metallo-hydrolase [Sphingomicrobium sp. XHP0239]|uniref:M20/M25/M40 family metallo-hydrolase n=1 Tax=Sphingomicrobium maritimum TaxID=3133972 RepID=UPI0031CCD6FC
MRPIAVAPFIVGAAILATPAVAQEHHHEGNEDHHVANGAMLAGLSQDVSEARLRADIDGMVGFGTRHTLSSQDDPDRGVGAAVDWVLAEMERIGLEPVRVCETVTVPPRIPEPTRVCNAVGIKRGTTRPNDVVIYTAHLDSRVSDVMNSTADAPGANDSASGVAGGLEAARLLADQEFPGTIIIAALTGEEQGLVGARILADYAGAQGWNVVANFNKDMIGANCGSDGYCEPDVIRVFSEGPRRQGNDEAMRAAMHRLGGENDAPSRNLSRWLDDLADRVDVGLDVRQVWRTDRWGRGGDHIRFLEAGYPAVRVTVPVEDYDHQHQDLRTEDGTFYGDVIAELDFGYMAKATRLNTAAMAALSLAPPPPMGVEAAGAVQTDTTLMWDAVPSADHYKVVWRRTDASNWGEEHARADAANCNAEGRCELVLEGIRVDDWMFGVAAASADHFYSPVVSAVPGGDFAPVEESQEE